MVTKYITLCRGGIRGISGVWCLQLAYLENFREEKQSVSTAHTKDRQKEREAEREGEKVRQRVAVLNWDKDKTNSVDFSPLGFLTLHNVPVLPLRMLPGIKQEVYHG